MRLILDTNVLLSAMIAPLGTPGALVSAWRSEVFQVATSTTHIAELRRVAAREYFAKRLGQDAVDEMVQQLTLRATSYPDRGIAVFPRDPKDSYLLDLAGSSGADYLVTGDRPLQELARHGETAIVSPAQMLALLVGQV